MLVTRTFTITVTGDEATLDDIQNLPQALVNAVTTPGIWIGIDPAGVSLITAHETTEG